MAYSVTVCKHRHMWFVILQCTNMAFPTEVQYSIMYNRFSLRLKYAVEQLECTSL